MASRATCRLARWLSPLNYRCLNAQPCLLASLPSPCQYSFSTYSVGKQEVTAMDMIKYAASLKSDEASYAEAIRVLEQGLTYFTGNELSSTLAAGRVQLALATIHANRSNVESAAECLQKLVDTTSATLEVKGAALEALTGLCLQTHQDDAALEHADRFMELVQETDEIQDDFKYRAAASKRLADLARAPPNAESERGTQLDLEHGSGAAMLACAESFHVQKLFSLSKEFYEKSINFSKQHLEENSQQLSAIAMVPEATEIGALAGLGQLLTIMGNFDEAESQLTRALKQAEMVKGEKHPQVGIILSCIGDLYQRRAIAEGKGDSLIIEGVYKSALDLMQAPPLDKDVNKNMRLVDIIALTWARLGVNLAPASRRRGEAEKLKQWVQAAWKNSRPLPEFGVLAGLLANDATKLSDPYENLKDKATVVDVRIARVFYT